MHGTIAVVKYERQRVLIAADSRNNFGIDAVSHFRDDANKIAALGEYAAFVSSGFVGYDNAGPRDQLQSWRATDLAHAEFEHLIQEHGEWLDTHLDALALSIGGALVARIAELALYAAPTVQAAAVGGLLTTGLLATGRGTEVAVALIQVGLNSNGQVQLLALRRITPETCPPCALGRGEVVIELLGSSTQRAKLAMERLHAEVAILPEAEREVRRVTRLAELSIAWLPADAGVGGPVDVLELRAGERLRWIQRKS